MEGFNNFEQGILIACALFSTFSIMWLAIIFTSYCKRQISIEVSTDAIAINVNRIAMALESPPVEISESAESIARRIREEQERQAAALPNVIKAETFGGMTEDDRAAKRRARRIAECKVHNEHPWLARHLDIVPPHAMSVSCESCNGNARILRSEDGKARALGEFI